MALFDLRHPFFRPKWRRVATCLVLAGWALFELSTAHPGFALMFGAVAAYAAYEFFVIYDPANYEDPEDE